MKYTYEMSREVKAMLAGNMDAFYKFYIMTVNDVYFHTKLVIGDEQETEKMIVSIYRGMYVKLYQLERPEDTIMWMNRIIYHKLNEWVIVHCTPMIMQEDEGKYDNFYFDDTYVFSENMLTEAESANLAAGYIGELSSVHALAALAYFYDSIANDEIATLLDCDEVRINTRTRYARKVIESKCMAYARENTLDVRRIDVHLLLLAYVSLSKSYGVEDMETLYVKIQEALA